MFPEALTLRAQRAIALATILLWVSAAHTQPDNISLIEAALQRLDAADQDDTWFFTLQLTENQETRVISHDPLRAPYEQRTLLRVDGQPPDADRLKEFRKEEEKRVDDRDPDAGYRRLVILDTLELSKNEGDYVHYTFSPRIKPLEKAGDKLRGTLTLDTSTGQIRDIEVFTAEPFSPAFSVTLDNYRLQFIFREEQGARLLQRMESTAAGKAGFIKAFESVVVVDFSDYRPASRTFKD